MISTLDITRAAPDYLAQASDLFVTIPPQSPENRDVPVLNALRDRMSSSLL